MAKWYDYVMTGADFAFLPKNLNFYGCFVCVVAHLTTLEQKKKLENFSVKFKFGAKIHQFTTKNGIFARIFLLNESFQIRFDCFTVLA